MTLPVRAVLAEYRARLEEIYGPRLRDLVLFGSQARGDADADSDIDVMIVLSDPLDHWKELQRTSKLTSELSLKYDTVLSRVFVTPNRVVEDHGYFYQNVRREGIFL